MTVVRGPGGLGRPHHNKNTENARLYLPSIYRYSCLGAFHVSTDTPGSVGTCRGIRSSLEHVLDLDVASRNDAIHQFTTQEEDIMQVRTPSLPESSDSAAIQQEAVKMLEEKEHANPALIYPPRKPKKNIHKFPVIAPEPETKLKVQDATKNTTTNEILEDDDEYASRILHESWSAYGSTEIECLQLTSLKDGSTEIVAVAPYNHALVSYRNVDLVEGSSATSFQIGFRHKLMLLLENTHERKSTSEQTQQHQKEEPEAMPDPKRSKKPMYDTESSIFQDFHNSTPEQWWESATQAASQAKQWGDKTYQFSTKITDKMHSNRDWLNEQLSQDFYSRTVASGKRTIDYMPTMAIAVAKTMKQLLGFDDDSNNDPPGGPPPVF